MNITEFLNNPIWGGIRWTMELENRIDNPVYLEKYGYKVYSQNDEDGIINEIFKRVGIKNHLFLEFGVDKGIECNTHALLLQGWKGMWIEGSETAYNQVVRRFAPAIRRGELQVLNQYVDPQNIDSIIKCFVGNKELDLLSIDVDGNDYHIWKAIDSVNPRVVIIEYQGKFPPEIDWVMAYNENHVWDRSDRSGASLKAMERLGRNKGYQLVGTNICGVNAFFVRSDIAEDRFAIPATAENLYNPVRSNIVKHNNGNPCINFVGQDIVGMEGVFEYYPDWNSLASYGFWKVEITPNGRRNVVKEKKALLFVRGITHDKKKISIKVSVDVPIIELGELELYIRIENKVTNHKLDCEEKEIVLDIDGMKYEGKILPIEFNTNLLWNSYEMTGEGIDRLRGIAIEDICFF